MIIFLVETQVRTSAFTLIFFHKLAQIAQMAITMMLINIPGRVKCITVLPQPKNSVNLPGKAIIKRFR